MHKIEQGTRSNQSMIKPYGMRYLEIMRDGLIPTHFQEYLRLLFICSDMILQKNPDQQGGLAMW